MKRLIDPFDFDPQVITDRIAAEKKARKKGNEKRFYNKTVRGPWGGKRPGAGRKKITGWRGEQKITVKYTQLQLSMLEEAGGVEKAVNKWIKSLI